LEQFARRAAANRVDILLLPEAYIGGYPRGTHFGSVIGSRSREGRDEYLRYFQSAVDLGDTVGDGAGAGEAWLKRKLPSDAVSGSKNEAEALKDGKRGDGTREELERIAHDTGVFLVTGLVERAGGSLYCSAVYVCPKLGVIGKRRKVMPVSICPRVHETSVSNVCQTGTERLVWAQGSPATLRAVSTTIRGVRINLAAAICWENYMPLLRQALYAQNINLYLAPTADGRDAWLSVLRTAAIEGRCFVLSSNMCVRSSQAPPSAPLASTNGHGPSESALQDDEETDGAAPDPSPFSPGTVPRTASHGRRKSVFDDDGNEIALPCSPPHHAPAARRRRQSIFDEDGNEIALPCSPPARTTSRGRETARPRRQSVFDEDGNEIVLCAGGGSRSGSVWQQTHQSAPPLAPTTAASAAAKPEAIVGSRKAEFASRGGSAIISPFGDVLAGPQWEDDEGIIYADVDFDDCIRGRLDLDTAGSYSRNDSFRLEVAGLDLTPLPY
jgi:nitrilase